jgi:hypothetical protein
MSLISQSSKSTAVMATAGASAPPSLLEQVAMAGGAAVITVTFIHPIDVVKVSNGRSKSILILINTISASAQ